MNITFRWHTGAPGRSRVAERSALILRPRPTAPGWAASLAAGAVAGVVAAVASVGVEIVTLSRLPPRVPTLWSAFVAGILAGLLYGGLCRMVRRPVVALWVVTLVLATIDSLLIALLPGASGRSPSLGIPISGLLTPLRQVLALAGIGHLGTRRFPGAYLPVATITHYITVVAVSLIVPRVAKPRG